MSERTPDAAASPEWSGAFATLLESIEPAARDEILAGLSERTLAEGEVLIEFMKPVHSLHVVRTGLLRSELPDRHGLHIELGTTAAGDFCGEMSFLRSEPATATVRAVMPSVIASISHVALASVAERYPALLWQIGAVVATKLGQANQRMRAMGACSVVICDGIDAEWPARTLSMVARSAASHLRRPVLLLSLSPVGLDPPQAIRFDSIAAALDRVRESMQRAEGAETAVHLLHGSPAQLPLDGVMSALPELRRHYGLVMIAAGDATRLDALEGVMAESSAKFLEFRPEAEAPRTRHRATSGRHETVLLRRSRSPVLPSGLEALGSSDERVVAVIPGGMDILTAESHHDDTMKAVDWVARHLTGKKVGIAFGAGGSKGYAHLGIVARLKELGVRADYAAGCSIGAPIAAAVADELPLSDTKEALDRTFARALRPTIPYTSFLSTRSLRADLERISQGRSFEELKGPLAIVAVDQHARCEVVLREGSVSTAMLASLAIPGIFPPVVVGDRSLVDGALLNPIPNGTVAEMGADVVIGLRLSNAPAPTAGRRRRASPFRTPPIVDTILNAFEVMQWKIASESLSRADIAIAPEFRGLTGLRDFNRGDEFIEFGRDAVDAALPQLREFLPWVH